jgi:sporulation protein YlmC with PRC-barrel domain
VIKTFVAILSISIIAGSTILPAQAAAEPVPASSSLVATSEAIAAGESGQGMRMSDKAAIGVRFTTIKPADFMSSKLIGAKVYNNKDEWLGDIKDLVVADGKTVTRVVVGVGGFLGFDKHYVVIDPSKIVLNKKKDQWQAFIDTNDDTLKNAPKFKYSNASE